MTTETILTDNLSLIEQLREYADNNGYSHNDYADTMTLAANALERAIEQAVLQSPEIQALRRDAERYRWLRDPCSGAEHVVMYGRGDYGKGLKSGSTLDDDIDAAMEQQA